MYLRPGNLVGNLQPKEDGCPDVVQDSNEWLEVVQCGEFVHHAAHDHVAEQEPEADYDVDQATGRLAQLASDVKDG